MPTKLHQELYNHIALRRAATVREIQFTAVNSVSREVKSLRGFPFNIE
jgi:hypothetical protein